jgi:hypothetical protein
MSVTGHLEELRRSTKPCPEAVEAAQRRPGTDDLEIARMKKQKLHIKEEITRLRRTSARGNVRRGPVRPPPTLARGPAAPPARAPP